MTNEQFISKLVRDVRKARQMAEERKSDGGSPNDHYNEGYGDAMRFVEKQIAEHLHLACHRAFSSVMFSHKAWDDACTQMEEDLDRA